MGSIALSNIIRGAFQNAFLGYKLDKNEINKGYMSEAVNEIIKFAFDNLNLHRIEANVLPRNKASMKVLEKNGFILEGYSKDYLKIDDEWKDHIHMVKLNKKL
ncbi:GNAT family N-acetyltransferase [Hypnocyclicus thermotrophus]|nr:GNAT family protein [Hypnocyclicus thermotrophus]